MRLIHALVGVMLVTIATPATIGGQALTSLASLRVRYNSAKVSTNPQGELRARLDTLDREIADAGRAGHTGELRRLFAKGTTLLAGRPWTDEADYGASIVLRTDRVIVDPSTPLIVRLEQIHMPVIRLERAPSARVLLRRRAPTAVAGAPLDVVRDFGTFDGVARDLRDAPYAFELDLTRLSSGPYLLEVIISDTRTLGTAVLPLVIREGLDATVARLEKAASTAPEAVRADVLYPVDRMRNVNRGRMELRTFDADKELADATAVAAAAASGKDPYRGRTGDFERHYLLAPAREIMPFRLLVPTGYRANRPAPLIIALHGLGGTEDAFFDGYGRKMPEHAERRGYIIAAPLGYRVDGGYGYGVGTPPADVVARRALELSEQDVMEVLRQVRSQYRIDEQRIYLMGHSMGAIGTWKIAAKFPEQFAALGLFAGAGNPATVERIERIPQFVVHGDADPTVAVGGSRVMVEALKLRRADVQYIEVAGGTHSNVVEPNFGAMFDFFDARSRTAGKPSP